LDSFERGPREIAETEERALNAWPSLQTLLLDGWVLRFSGGYTRRANSVVPLYRPRQPLADQIEQCEALYGAQGLPAVFKLTAASQPAELDAELQRRGYVAEAETIVQRLELAAVAASSDPDVRLVPRPDADWIRAFSRLAGLGGPQRSLAARLFDALALPARFALLEHGGQVAAVGMAVLQHSEVGLYDIVVDETLRGQGLGKRIIHELLEWSRSYGARGAYLQVLGTNAPALRLYEKVGFLEAYRYWYRREPHG
jgi:N-acetylglutamate synthase